MTGKFLSEDNGATLYCDTCNQQVRSNEVHRCQGPVRKRPKPRVADTKQQLLKLVKQDIVRKFLALQHSNGELFQLNKVLIVQLSSQRQAQCKHPLRLEAMLADWILAFNKFGVGVWFEPSNSPLVNFAKDSVTVQVHYEQLLRHGMNTILQMFHPLPDSAVPPRNLLEGFEDANADADADADAAGDSAQ